MVHMTTATATRSTARSQREVFTADLDKMNRDLAPWLVTFDDGFQGYMPSAPAQLLSAYSGLVSFGYANGWMA
jgi:hypothetical protein